MDTMSILQLLGSTIGIGLFQKHVIKKLPNNLIPYINTVIGTILAPAFGLPAETGAMVGLSSVGVHQAIKIPVRSATGKSL